MSKTKLWAKTKVWSETELNLSSLVLDQSVAMYLDRQFCCSFVANLLQCLYNKNYQNIMQFNKVIAKIKGAIFLSHYNLLDIM